MINITLVKNIEQTQIVYQINEDGEETTYTNIDKLICYVIGISWKGQMYISDRGTRPTAKNHKSRLVDLKYEIRQMASEEIIEWRQVYSEEKRLIREVYPQLEN